MKIINLHMEDEVYYKLVELKGKLKCNNWNELMKKIVEGK